jgi:small-conductance mechanosensitive channel
MSGKSISRYALVALALFLIGGLLMVDSNAQKRKRKRRSSAPRITNPEIYQPPTNENANTSATDLPSPAASPTPEDPEAMKKTIRTLSNQVDKLTDKITQMEESQRSLVDLERLARAEQRSSQLRSEQRDVQAKIGELEVRLEDVTFALKPENIERATAVYGTTRPEEIRAQRKRQLETERDRVQRQLEQLRASDARLTDAIATSDTEVERLQKKLDAADRSAIENEKTKVESGDLTQPSPTPIPTPTPWR